MLLFPVINPVATGRNILRFRIERGLSVRDIQHYFGFDAPQAIYKWQRGDTLPSIDNLYALARLFGCSMDEILVGAGPVEIDMEWPSPDILLEIGSFLTELEVQAPS